MNQFTLPFAALGGVVWVGMPVNWVALVRAGANPWIGLPGAPSGSRSPT